eukprot:14792600-Ditylum_brightwellii.AAC.1
MESGAYAWAAAPSSNPGQSAHFSGGEKQWQVGLGSLGCNWASALALREWEELWLPAWDYDKGVPHSSVI